MLVSLSQVTALYKIRQDVETCLDSKVNWAARIRENVGREAVERAITRLSALIEEWERFGQAEWRSDLAWTVIDLDHQKGLDQAIKYLASDNKAL